MTDGILKVCKLSDLVVGNVVRTVSEDGRSSSFSDCVIVRVFRWQEDGQLSVDLQRPRMSVENGEPVLAVEKFNVSAQRLLELDSRFRLVCLASGTPHNVAYNIPQEEPVTFATVAQLNDEWARGRDA